MKTKLLIAGILAAAGALGAVQLVNFPQMRFTVHVVGEDGAPIPDASATLIFNEAATGFGKKAKVAVTTDGSGNFTVEGYSENGVIAFDQSLSKDGYYESGLPISNFQTFKDGHWLPWDQTYTTTLRKIGNRISMYAKQSYGEIPSADQPCGYDLEAGDWVAPWGSGKIADFVITLKRQYQDDRNFDDTVTLTFSNPGDGIQETQLPKEFAYSRFIWPREAPDAGYNSDLTLHYWSDSKSGMHGDAGNAIANKKYFFRVRTEKQGDQIISALYGKINAGIELHPSSSKTCGISIFYYLNPTSLDRNMEYSGSNLFKNLPQSENTHQP